MELFNDLVWSLPSYSNNAIYCRSLGEIACVDLVGESTATIDSADSKLPTGKRFQALLNGVANANSDGERKKVVDDFWALQEQMPFVEDDIVHFLYRGDAKDVAVASDIFGARQERAMLSVAGTDLRYYSMRLPRDQRANYMFLVDYVPQVDTKNERKVISSVYRGEMEFAVRLRNEKPLTMSWFAMPDWSEPQYLQGLGEKRGEIVQHKIKPSETNPDAAVYLPSGYKEDVDQRYRVVYVFADPGHGSTGALVPAFENLLTLNKDVEPAILVFPQFAPFGPQPKSLVKDLIPSIDKNFRTIADREHRSCVGFGFMAGGALGPIVKNPDSISRVAVFSPMVFDAEMKQIEKAMKELETEIEVYVDWGRFDIFNPVENWDVREMAGRIKKLGDENPNIKLSGGMVNDTSDWSSWRNRYDVFLGN